MGDMADFINDQIPYWGEDDFNEPEEEDGPATWTTREGVKMLVSDMTDTHLVNALRLMDRKGFVPAQEFSDYMCGSQPNGEAAMDAWNEGLSEMMEKHPSSKMDDLAAEAMQRGIEWRMK